jgi:NAD(P)H-hydrate repair Nnr-like enzyme with NAD(P)H-hydrate dehydratase domain
VSSLRSGADLSHVFTPDKDALIPIKCYSPELIVHPAEKA